MYALLGVVGAVFLLESLQSAQKKVSSVSSWRFGKVLYCFLTDKIFLY